MLEIKCHCDKPERAKNQSVAYKLNLINNFHYLYQLAYLI